MVVKLTGKVNGETIIFERKAGGLWVTAIPRVKSGAYAVELTAVDEAGNETFCTKYILTVDLGALAVKLEPFPYSVQLLQSSFREGMRMTATFDYGESKHIRLLVVSRKKEDFDISSASYVPTKDGANDPEDSGNVVIDEHVLDALIAPMQKGRYKLTITYHITNETFVEEVHIAVL